MRQLLRRLEMPVVHELMQVVQQLLLGGMMALRRRRLLPCLLLSYSLLKPADLLLLSQQWLLRLRLETRLRLWRRRWRVHGPRRR